MDRMRYATKGVRNCNLDVDEPQRVNAIMVLKRELLQYGCMNGCAHLLDAKPRFQPYR